MNIGEDKESDNPYRVAGKVQTNGSDDQVVTERTGTCGKNFGG